MENVWPRFAGHKHLTAKSRLLYEGRTARRNTDRHTFIAGKEFKARVFTLSKLKCAIAAGGPFVLDCQDGMAWRLFDEAG
jgi:hypothetical protein